MPDRDIRFQTGLVTTIASAHFIHDVFTSFPAPLLPLIIDKLGLNLVSAGSLLVFMQIPSLFNPLLGALADRANLRRVLIPLGLGGTGIFICLMGLAPGYGALAGMLLVVGCAVAAFHVTAPPMIQELAGDRVGRGMGFFMVGGELARTVGPLVAVAVVSTLGLVGMWKLIPVAVVASMLVWWRLGTVPETRSPERRLRLIALWRRMSGLLVGVAGILMARAFMVAGLTGYLPTFIYGTGESLWMANLSLSLLELGGAAGVFLSGTLSDRIGRRPVLLGAVALSPVLLLLFLGMPGPYRLPVLVILGVVSFATTPVLLAVTVENAGANTAAATGTFMMFSFAARSLIILVVGAMGDAVGLRTAYLWCAALAALGLPFVFLIPRRR
jgi:FSR family fosmidomycin resistance protein-like MFS transporter